MFATMAVDDMHNQHIIWSQQQQDNGPPEVVSQEHRTYLLAAFVLVSFALLGYILFLVKEAEKKEQKTK